MCIKPWLYLIAIIILMLSYSLPRAAFLLQAFFCAFLNSLLYSSVPRRLPLQWRMFSASYTFPSLSLSQLPLYRLEKSSLEMVNS